MKKLVSLWFPVIIWCGFIFYLSSIPDLKIQVLGIWDLVLRKIAHVVEFGILAVLFYRAIKGSFFWLKRHLLFWSFFLTLIYAILDEIHQSYVPGRVPSPIDIGIDTIGIAGALFITSQRGKVL